MNHIELQSPLPRETKLPYAPYRFVIENHVYLPKPTGLPDVSFWQVVASRESRRTFGAVSEKDLGSLLWHTAKTKGSRIEDGSLVWQSRGAPSAGGVHPMDILLIDGPRQQPRLRVYDPLSHSLCAVRPADDASVIKLVCVADAIVSIGDGTLMWFIAQFGKTIAKYEHGETLVWRDAGALLSTFYFVAEALNLNCCGIGATGDPMVANALCDDRLRGVGGCLVGSRGIT